MAENQEFLAAHQCFIVFDSLSRKIAISIRNRLSKEGIKCTIWDEKHFEDNEYRLSNFNRILFLSAKYADEYLSNPEIKEEISDFVIYRREGRTASLTLVDSKVKFDDVYKELETKYKEFVATGQSISDKEKKVLDKLTPEDVEESLKLVPVNNVPLLPAPKEGVMEQKASVKEAAKIVAKYGGGINTGAYKGTDGNYYPGYGLAQWTSSGRKEVTDCYRRRIKEMERSERGVPGHKRIWQICLGQCEEQSRQVCDHFRDGH